MGRLVLHEWARLLALSAGAYMAWASFWAFFYRKFFWDMIGGTLGPAGIIPGANTQPLVNVIVNIPLLQSFTLVLGLATLAIEWPLPFIAGTRIHRSFAFRAICYFITGFLGLLIYQTINGGIYMVITSFVYTMAIYRGETMQSTKQGSAGQA